MAHPDTRTHTFFLWVTILTAALGGFLFGYDTGVISGAILFIRKEFALTIGQEQWIVSVVSLGGVAGAMISGPMSDRFGRKATIIFSSLLFVFSAFWLSWAKDTSILIVGRLIIGMAIGISAAGVPVYIAELSPPKNRGTLVTIFQLAITIGLFVAFLIGYAFVQEQGWRWMFRLAAFPALLQLVGMLFLPESPRWLVSHKHTAKARSVLLKIRKTKAVAEAEIDEISSTIKEELPGWRELISAAVRPALLAGVGLTIVQQITGINCVLYYGPTLFQLAGFASESSAILANTFVGLINVLMTFIAIWLLDRIGRKPLLYTGLSGMVLALALIGVAFMYKELAHVLGWIAVICFGLYVACFAFSLGPCGWLINSEIYSLRVRGRAMAIVVFFNWAANFLATGTFLSLIQAIGISATFWLYGAIALLGVIFIALKIPETKGKTLESIEAYWHSKAKRAR